MGGGYTRRTPSPRGNITPRGGKQWQAGPEGVKACATCGKPLGVNSAQVQTREGWKCARCAFEGHKGSR